ncbi:tyrosine-type recombinase/integrase [Akkermansiaceae bacterium]|nr:tyrosine-type recombinase/integrase [Akkermansiaceae bacterium]
MVKQGGAKVTLRELDKDHLQRKKLGYRWLVESRINGKRSRKFFTHGNKKEAEKFKTNLEKQIGKLANKDREILLDDDILAEAAQAHKDLTPFNRSIKDAVTFYIEHLEAKAKQDSTSLNEAIGVFLDAKTAKGIKSDTVKRYRETLNRFEKAFPARTVSSIEGKEIERWWETFGTVANQRANRTDVNVFFNWMVKSTRFENITTNPVPAPPEINKKTKLAKKRVMLSPPEVEKFLKSCAEHDENLFPLIVAQVFIGARPEESLRLDWSHFDFKAGELNITADIAKGGEKHARTNKIPKNAMAWLAPYRFKTSGKVLPGVYSKSAFDKRMRAARAKAGWEPGKWPQNALRKTFISCHYASFSKVSKTAAIAGTSESVIFSNYRSSVNKTAAKKLWKIVPDGTEKPETISAA